MSEPKDKLSVSEEVRMFSDLESDDPSIITLEWLKREAPIEVFRDTLLLVLDGSSYNCDEVTICWARAQLDQLQSS
ncbi:MAG: hypothetical protein HYS18_11520 [Burkholderiales bacterium]|nr:hypothetical protein [Burkholderiales bacterium]